MRLVEKLDLIYSPEYRLSLTEDDLLLLAELLLTPRKEPVIFLELAEILKHVKSDRYRQFQKLASKLKKAAR